MTTIAQTLDMIIRIALGSKDISTATAQVARALDAVMPGTAPHIVLAAAITLSEEHDLMASQIRRQFPMGGITFDLVTDVVEKMEKQELAIRNR